MKVYVSTGPATVEVPNLVGKTEADARALLTGAGLIVREPPGSRCSDDVNAGKVAKQNPEPGTPVQKGKAIAFDLANSPCTVFVPTVVGMPLDDAIARLQRETINPNSIRTTPLTRDRSERRRQGARPGHPRLQHEALRGHAHGRPARPERLHDAHDHPVIKTP